MKNFNRRRKINNDNDSVYIEKMNSFVKRCDDNYLYLNILKTKEMCIDFRKCRNEHTPVCIQGKRLPKS